MYLTIFFSCTGYMMPSGKIIVNDEMKCKMWPVTNLRHNPEFSLAGGGSYKKYKGPHQIIYRGIIYIGYENILAMHFIMIQYVD
jgi:hypothetical protein